MTNVHENLNAMDNTLLGIIFVSLFVFLPLACILVYCLNFTLKSVRKLCHHWKLSTPTLNVMNGQYIHEDVFVENYLRPKQLKIGHWWRYRLWYLKKLWCEGRVPNLADHSELIESVISRFKNQRHLFLNNEILNVFPTRNSHSHPNAAAFRSAVNNYMTDIVIKSGYSPFQVSMSATDKCDGTRLFYGQKDFSVPYKHDAIKSDHVLIMTDVDYYTDINRWLEYGQPLLMYTCVPRKVVNRTSDYVYRIRDNLLEMIVAGGSSYKHPLWDYKGDTVSVVTDAGTKTERLIVYNIEQRLVPGDPDHRYIVFTPIAQIPAPYYYYVTDEQPIERKRFRHDIVYLYDPITDNLSISRNGTWHSVELTGQLYIAMTERLEQKTTPTLIVDVERHLRSAGYKEAAVMAPLIYTLMGCNIEKNTVITNGCITSYHPLGTLVNDDGKQSGAQVSTPLVTTGAVFPTNSYSSDEATVNGRIHKMKNVKVPKRQFSQWAIDFTNYIVNNKHKGGPIPTGEVMKLQNSPQQKARQAKSEATFTTKPANELKSFVKVEPYVGVNDPRNITTMSSELTTEMSSFTIPFKNEVLKRFAWFGPGKTPAEACKRLMDIAVGIVTWLVIDYHRMDGTISEWLQKHIVKPCYMMWVSHEYKPQFSYLFDQVMIDKGTTKHGVKFKPGFGVRSGSPITTESNTLIACFVIYAAYRMSGCTHEEAVKKLEALCLFYGDDGAKALKDEKLKSCIMEVCKQLGLSIKLAEIPVGEPIPYLGRYFVDPATTSDSLQDPKRTITKLHLTANKSVTKEQAQFNKATGYLATDKLTPIIGTFAKKVIEHHKGYSVKGLTNEEKFKIQNSWPQRDKDRIRDCMAKLLNIESSELMKLDEKVDECADPSKFPVLLETTLKVAIPAIYGDTIVTPGDHISNDDIQSEAIRPELPATAQQASSGDCDTSAGHRGQDKKPQKQRGKNRSSGKGATSPKRHKRDGETNGGPDVKQSGVRDGCNTRKRTRGKPMNGGNVANTSISPQQPTNIG